MDKIQLDKLLNDGYLEVIKNFKDNKDAFRQSLSEAKDSSDKMAEMFFKMFEMNKQYSDFVIRKLFQ